MEISVILEPDVGGYIAYVPSIQGCHAQGKTREETLKNIREVIGFCLELDPEDIPRDKQATIEKISL